jgi:uncharacterized membrane protein
MQTTLSLVPANRVLLTAAGLGAITGVRSMAAPALLAHELSTGGGLAGAGTRIGRFLGSSSASRLLAVLAGGEMLADKTFFVPDRTSPGPLIGRAVIGSLTAAAYAANRRHPVLIPAAVGAASAIGFRLRGLPPPASRQRPSRCPGSAPRDDRGRHHRGGGERHLGRNGTKLATLGETSPELRRWLLYRPKRVNAR